MVVKLRPNTPRQLDGSGFSRSPYTLVGLGWDLDLVRDLDPDLRLDEYLDLLLLLDLDPGLGDGDLEPPGERLGGEGDLLSRELMVAAASPSLLLDNKSVNFLIFANFTKCLIQLSIKSLVEVNQAILDRKSGV